METHLAPEIANFWWRLLAVVLLLVANGLFVAIEFALVGSRRGRFESLAQAGARGAKLALRVMAEPDRVLAAAQLGITMASLALGWIGEPFVSEVLRWPLGLIPANDWFEPGYISHTVSMVIAFAIITSAHIVLGEQAPKIFSIGQAERTIIFLAPFILLFDRLLRPFISILDRATSATLRLVGAKPVASQHRAILSIDELKRIVSDSQEDGLLEPSEEVMLRNVFEFADREVSEAMVPRLNVVGVEMGATVADFLAIYAQSPHSRYPVYEGALDRIQGFVGIKDILTLVASQGQSALQLDITPLLRLPLVVPEFKHIGDLFEEMQEQGVSLTVVVDEYGGTAGIVTLHGLLEKIVGRLRDENGGDDPAVNQVDEQTAVVDGELTIDEVNNELELDLPKKDAYETLAGLILFQLERLPKPGEQLDLDGTRLTVTEMTGSKIEKVEVKRLTVADGEVESPIKDESVDPAA